MSRPVDGQVHRDRLRRRQTGRRLSWVAGGTEIRVSLVIGHPQLLSCMSYTTFVWLLATAADSPKPEKSGASDVRDSGRQSGARLGYEMSALCQKQTLGNDGLLRFCRRFFDQCCHLGCVREKDR